MQPTSPSPLTIGLITGIKLCTLVGAKHRYKSAYADFRYMLTHSIYADAFDMLTA